MLQRRFASEIRTMKEAGHNVFLDHATNHSGRYYTTRFFRIPVVTQFGVRLEMPNCVTTGIPVSLTLRCASDTLMSLLSPNYCN